MSAPFNYRPIWDKSNEILPVAQKLQKALGSICEAWEERNDFETGAGIVLYASRQVAQLVLQLETLLNELQGKEPSEWPFDIATDSMETIHANVMGLGRLADELAGGMNALSNIASYLVRELGRGPVDSPDLWKDGYKRISLAIKQIKNGCYKIETDPTLYSELQNEFRERVRQQIGEAGQNEPPKPCAVVSQQSKTKTGLATVIQEGTNKVFMFDVGVAPFWKAEHDVEFDYFGEPEWAIDEELYRRDWGWILLSYRAFMQADVPANPPSFRRLSDAEAAEWLRLNDYEPPADIAPLAAHLILGPETLATEAAGDDEPPGNVATIGAGADDATNVDCETANESLTEPEANELAMRLANEDSTFLDGTAEQWAQRIREASGRQCSGSLVRKTTLWKKTMDKTGRTRTRGRRKPKRSLHGSEVVERLAAEQRDDPDPSPLTPVRPGDNPRVRNGV